MIDPAVFKIAAQQSATGAFEKGDTFFLAGDELAAHECSMWDTYQQQTDSDQLGENSSAGDSTPPATGRVGSPRPVEGGGGSHGDPAVTVGIGPVVIGQQGIPQHR